MLIQRVSYSKDNFLSSFGKKNKKKIQEKLYGIRTYFLLYKKKF